MENHNKFSFNFCKLCFYQKKNAITTQLKDFSLENFFSSQSDVAVHGPEETCMFNTEKWNKRFQLTS